MTNTSVMTNTSATNNTVLTRLESLGFDLARNMVQAEKLLNSTKKELTINLINSIKLNELPDVLTGYNNELQAYMSKASASNRTSELKAVTSAILKADTATKNELLEIDGWNNLVTSSRNFLSLGLAPSELKAQIENKKALQAIQEKQASEASEAIPASEASEASPRDLMAELLSLINEMGKMAEYAALSNKLLKAIANNK